ncbi:NADase-type glycan-binding domain-containing protein [Kitasatospora sp. NPDC101176]|uniref:NADase-type glycan-binding domain-containing protein n=1 Tax=Kitasatospora sp. NPDC101176 TaxID=3364099 RepID=UPI00380FE2DF
MPGKEPVRGTSLTKTVPDPPAKDEPTEVVPQAAVRRPPVRAPHRTPRRREVGDVLCPECGAGNDPGRKFCRSCGASLEAAEVVRRPWWRRFVPRRRHLVLKAGARPGQPGVKSARGLPPMSALAGPVRMVASVAALTVAVLYSVHPPFRAGVWNQVATVQKTVNGLVNPKLSPVHPIRTVSNLALPDHPPEAATEGYSNTFWAFPTDGDRPVLTLEFQHPARLDGMLVYNGSTTEFKDYSRVKEIEVSYGNGKSEVVELADHPERQQIRLHSNGAVSTITLTVRSYYDAPGKLQGALSELEAQTQTSGSRIGW